MKKKEVNELSAIRFKDCRMHSNITQEELAGLSSYSIQQISYIENGKRPITIEAANIFAKIFHVDPEYLLCESPYRQKNSAQDSKYFIENELDLHFTDLMRLLGERILNISPDIEAIKAGKDCYDNTYVIMQTMYPELGYYKLTLKEYTAIKRDILEYAQFKFHHSGYYDSPNNFEQLNLDVIAKNLQQLANEQQLVGDDPIEKTIDNYCDEQFSQFTKL